MRILFLNHVSAIGGAEKSLLGLVETLPPDRYSCEAVLPGHGPLAMELEKRGCRVWFESIQRLKRMGSPLRRAWLGVRMAPVVLALHRLIRARRIDIVHSNSSTAHLYGGAAAWMAGVPCVWHCRDMVDLGRVGRWMGRTATRVVAVSEAVAGPMRRAGCGESGRLVVIHNGIDLEVFCPGNGRAAGRARLGIGDDEPLVAMIAHMAEWKRHELFLECAARVVREVPDARFVLAGSDLFGEAGDYVRGLRDKAERLLPAGRVLFAGGVENMAEFLDAVDVVVHPAEREPFGRGVAEAMAMGRAVVAIKQGGPSELIRDGGEGVLVPPGDAEAMADAVVRLCRDAGWRSALGRAARGRIVQSFGMTAFGEKIRRLYDELAGGIPANGEGGDF